MKERILPYVFPIALAAFWLWQLPGILPPGSYEADAVSIATGCELAARDSLRGLAHGAYGGYGYWMQPLVYWLVAGTNLLIPSLGCEAIYAALTALAALALQLLTALFVSKATGIGRTASLAALAMVPESYMLAMYPNSAAPALLPAVGGFLCLLRGRIAPGMALLAAAPLLRLDVVEVYPMMVPALMLSGRSFGRSLGISAAFGAVLAALLWGAYTLLGADVSFTLDVYAEWQDMVSTLSHFGAVFGFYGLLAPALIAAGGVLMAKSRDRRTLVALGMAVAAIIIVHTVNFRFGNAAKHYAPLLPFVAIPIAFAVRAIGSSLLHGRGWKRTVAAVATAGVAAVWLIGVRLNLDFPHVLTAQTAYSPEGWRIARVGGVEIAVGGGTCFNTSDETAMVSGYAFYPLYVHRVKEENRRRQAFVRSWSGPAEGEVAVSAGYNQWMRCVLLRVTGASGLNRAEPDAELENKIRDSSHWSFMDGYLRRRYAGARAVYILNTEATSPRLELYLRYLEAEGVVTPVGPGLYKADLSTTNR